MLMEPIDVMRCPIQKLPVETLTEIFRWYCSSDWDWDFSVTLDRPGRLVTKMKEISGTCSAWHQIICSDSSFWSSFNLELQCITNVGQSVLLNTFISRSGSVHLLRLYVSYPQSDIIDSQELENARLVILGILLDQSSRWRDVRLYIAPDIFGRAVSYLTQRPKPVHGYFPNLERLNSSDQDSTAEEYQEPNSDRSLFHIFYPCPALKRLSVHDVWNGNPIDCSRLTSLDLITYRGNSLSSLLSRCLHLRRFSIAYWDIPEVEDPDYEGFRPWSNSHPFQHLNLTTLSLPMYTEEFNSDIWEDVRFPSLNALEVDQVEESETGIPELLVMLTDSRCSLQTLILGEMSPDVFKEFLSITPSLVILTLTSHYTFRALQRQLKMLAPLFGTDSELPAPKLSCLTIKFSETFEGFRSISEHIHDMLISRRRRPESIRIKAQYRSEARSTLMAISFASLRDYFDLNTISVSGTTKSQDYFNLELRL
ncbi:hypothetical protein J3R30DRAFT_1139822 [Lentinula aciculospora]|uniref:F-box domain-containing protein n=1 Tax=Lentinula aciculospora TaxID=153920 RepID=A0A9W8ZZR8_9AGAR|nr:hypothetical protein J3R30DRAFT_1139822 [Lentinula aciculospora]